MSIFTPIWERLDLRKEEVPPAAQFIDRAVTCYLHNHALERPTRS